MTPTDSRWQELLEAAGDVLADALAPYGPGQPANPPLSPAMHRLADAVEAIDPSETSYP